MRALAAFCLLSFAWATPDAGVGRLATLPVPAGVDTLKKKQRVEALRAVIREHAESFQRCYERFLMRHVTLEGRLVLVLQIAKTGTVEKASVEDDTIGEVELAACIRAVGAKLKFPPAAKGEVLRYPFIFKPAE